MAKRTVTLTVELHADPSISDDMFSAWVDELNDAVSAIGYVSELRVKP